MDTWISLLRGINVGGKNILPMKDLRGVLGRLGYQDVHTYIQSGNCVFRCANETAQSIADNISAAIEQNFGFRPPVLAMPIAALKQALAENPYARQGLDNPKSVHLYFLSEPADNLDCAPLNTVKKANEAYEVSNRVLYLYAPDGIGRS